MPADQNLPTKLWELHKQFVRSTVSTIATIAGTIGRSLDRVVQTSRAAGKTVVGQTRVAATQTSGSIVRGAGDVASELSDAASVAGATAATGAKTIVGQTRAQSRRVSDRLGQEADSIANEVRRTTDGRPRAGTSYEDWTKAQLLDRARELDVDGRATMNKAELIKALRN